MKKTILALLLIVVLCFTACTAENSAASKADGANDAAGSTSGTANMDIWEGVEGDAQQFSVTMAGDTVYFNVLRDGSASVDMVYVDYTHLSKADEEELKDLDAEVAVFMTNYGTYRVEENTVVFTLESTSYMRCSLRGADAEEARTALMQSGPAEFKDPAIFDKGVAAAYSEEGYREYVLAFADGSYTLISAALVTDDEVANITFADDGSYTMTVSEPDGAVLQVAEYSAEGLMVKETCYNDDGSIDYVEVNVQDGENQTKTRTDGAGNVIYLEESFVEEKDGMTVETHRITDNGVVTSLRIIEYGGGLQREYERMLREDGSTYTRISVTDFSPTEERHVTEYSYSETICDGVRTDYWCSIGYSGAMAEGFRYASISYSLETDSYEVYQESIYGDQTRVTVSAADYTPADWETPIWNPGE